MVTKGKNMIHFVTRLIFMSTDFRVREETIMRCLICLLEICTEEDKTHHLCSSSGEKIYLY